MWFFDDNVYYILQTCTPRSSTILKCTAPKLPVVLLSSGTIERRAVPRSSLTGIINYTITMDGAEGPRSDQVDLQIVVKPNPVFYALHMNDRDYTLDSGRSIRILVIIMQLYYHWGNSASTHKNWQGQQYRVCTYLGLTKGPKLLLTS